MFKVLTGEKKRRAISPATLTASVAAHLLLLGGAVFASGGASTDAGETKADTTIVWDISQQPPPPPPPPIEQQPTPPAPVDEPARPPVPGEALEVPRVDQVPDQIVPETPGTPPVNEDDFNRDGRRGDYIGPVTEDPAPPSGDPTPAPVEDFVPGEDMVEVRPVLDRNGLARALERNYPALLRDSRVGGRVVIELIVEANGRPREGSARVVDASHPAFGEAALRAVDRFRFRPARIGGTAVPVRVTIPIVWTAN
jgi:protein TonB